MKATTDQQRVRQEARSLIRLRIANPPPLLLIDIFAYKPRILIKKNAFKLIKKRPMDHVAYVSKNCNVKIRFIELFIKTFG